VEPVSQEELLSVEHAVATLKTALDEAYAAEDKLVELLHQAGLMK